MARRPFIVVGIFPDDAAITRGPHGSPLPWGGTRLVGALLLEQNDEWAVQRSRYMTLESITQTGDNAAVSLRCSVPAFDGLDQF